jgi:hypothetical protein
MITRRRRGGHCDNGTGEIVYGTYRQLRMHRPSMDCQDLTGLTTRSPVRALRRATVR